MTTEKKDRMAEDDWESSVEFSGPTGNAAGVNFLWVGDAGSTEPLAAFDEAMLALRYLSNAAEDQPRDDHGRFAAHPGVGKLRELFGAKGIPHEHFSDEELSSMLHTAGSTPNPAAKERPAAARKEPAPVSEGHAERVRAVSDLKAHGERLADDPSTPTAVLDRHVADAEAAVDSHVKGMSADELKSMARAVGVVVGGGMGKGALVKEIKSVLTAPARAVLSIRQ